MEADWLGLRGKVCVVTGGAAGIGNAIAQGFGAVGARVHILDLDATGAELAAAEICKRGGQATSSVCDVSRPDSVDAAASACLAQFGQCDVLVNNAALLRPGLLASLSLQDWNALIAVNLTGYFLCAQAFGRVMRAHGGGSMIHVASISATVPQPFGGAYSVSKAGVLMLSRNIALEWGEYGVRSNVVCPAMVRTPLTAPIYQDPAVLAQRCAIVPLRRIGTTDDIADAAVFLASKRASYVTGAELMVDGGVQHGLLGLIPRPGFDRASAEASETPG